MRAVNLVSVFVLSLAATSVWAERDYIHAVGGVSFTHAHVRRIDGDLVDDPNSKTGKSWVGTKLSNVEETNRIPLQKGHGFNVQLLLFLLPVDTQFIDLTLSHPSMIGRSVEHPKWAHTHRRRNDVPPGIIYLHPGRGV